MQTLDRAASRYPACVPRADGCLSTPQPGSSAPLTRSGSFAYTLACIDAVTIVGALDAKGPGMVDRVTSPSRPGGPLTSLRVLELGAGVAVPFAGKLLADLGAKVTKLEWMHADTSRAEGPFPAGHEGDPDYSGLFVY